MKGGVPFAVGRKDVPFHASRGYVENLKWISERFFIFWEDEERRGWLVNGAGALLHLVRASLKQDSMGKIRSALLISPNQIEEPENQHDPDVAMQVLLNEKNRHIKLFREKEDFIYLEDRIDSLYEVMEKIVEHQYQRLEQARRSHQATPRRHLEGWNFKDLAARRDLYACSAKLHIKGKSWVDFTRSINAVTLFGRGFGEIILPDDLGSCSTWAKLPKLNSYLATCSADLQEIIELFEGDKDSCPMRLCEGIILCGLEPKTETCACHKNPGKHSELAQVLLPSRYCKILTQCHPVRLEKYGAVIFGHNSNFEWFWKDTGGPQRSFPEEDAPSLPSSPSEKSEHQFNDSGMGHSLDSLVKTNNATSSSIASPQESEQIIVPDKSSSISSMSGTESQRLGFNDYTVAILCALDTELKAVRLLFDTTHEDLKIASSDSNYYALGQMGKHNVVATCLPRGETGTSNAANVASNMNRSFPKIKHCLLVGIGGGVPSEKYDIRLGDIVISQPKDGNSGVIPYDCVKAVSHGRKKQKGVVKKPSIPLLSVISNMGSDPCYSPLALLNSISKIGDQDLSYRNPGKEYDRLFAADATHKSSHDNCDLCEGFIPRKDRDDKSPHVHYGLIASGNQVMKDAKKRDSLAKREGILCFETEAAGIMDIFECLAIRGISDYADSHKNDRWHNYAAATAAAYAKVLLSFVRENTASSTHESAIRNCGHSRKRKSDSLPVTTPSSSKTKYF